MKMFKTIKSKLGLDEKGIFIDFAIILLGSFLMALGIGVFLVDAKVVPGGVSGLAMAIHYLSNYQIPVGMTIWFLNIPLYIWGVRELGKQFGVRTLVGFTTSSFFIDLLRGAIPGLRQIQLQNSPAIVELKNTDFLFLVLIGAVLMGLGLGIIFKSRGSTGGVDIVAAIAQKRWGVKPGQAIMVIDFFVITLAGIIIYFRGLSTQKPAFILTLYAFFLLFISSRIIDVIIDGFDYARSAIIITTKVQQVSHIITHEMNRGATVLQGRGLYTNEDRDVLYTVLSRKEIGTLTRKVREIDPKAFVIVNNVHEVLGEGFRPRI